MSERIVKKICDARDRVNAYFGMSFKGKLIAQNEKALVNLENSCQSEKEFTHNISILATLVNDLDEVVIRSSLKNEYSEKGSVNLLEKFLKEKNLKKGQIIRNLRLLRRIRSTKFPIHKGTTKQFFSNIEKLGFKPPFNWTEIWKKCLIIYLESLLELSAQLDAHNTQLEFSKRPRKEITDLAEEKEVIYFNDFLFKYRILVPVDFGEGIEDLVDYLTASIIAYEKKLKSINYALRKYVTPLKSKFNVHKENLYFVLKRRFLNNEMLCSYQIMLPREKTILRDDKEFQTFFRHIYLAVIAYHIGVTPDWMIKGYGYSLASKRARN